MGEGENWEWLLNMYGVSLQDDENILELGSFDGYTT